jgi:CheY-like chemotaxis protein
MSEKTSASEKKQILIVDDSEDMRDLLEQVLEGAGYEVWVAEDGQAALRQATRHHPDLILMDLSLPGMTGWEAVEHLRHLPDFRDTPIIAVTAHVASGEVERAMAAGCSAHLGKPFEKHLLLQHIARLLGDQPRKRDDQTSLP